ncbi:5'(3')-deoxyribonucleotidase [Pedobacter sp. CCM 8938]|uniref:5'(3')-deoxyribonucleotidase n=2 Tax=Pedobacter fastidiosus TaxID=2765361 RepID=A0ABR7KQS0_9SPHI|nr:5'(3')-deoxyribonucleotidase [Pedobacter fastidiosus]
MDEVIADVIPKFLKLYNRDFGTPLDLAIEAGNEVFKQIPQDVNQKWLEYINEQGFFRDLEVVQDSQRVIKALQEKYDVYIVSAAMEFRNSLVDKYDWLADHFPFIDWQHIMFCGNKIVEVDVLIDDRIKNFVNFKGRPLLYTSPHNLLITEYERVNSWEEIAGLLL